MKFRIRPTEKPAKITTPDHEKKERENRETFSSSYGTCIWQEMTWETMKEMTEFGRKREKQENETADIENGIRRNAHTTSTSQSKA